MKKEELFEKLKDLGIETKNAFPKSSFIYNKDVHIGLYEREMKDDFYFVNKYDGKIYRWNHDLESYDYDDNTEKYMIPLSRCKLVWEDKPFVEKPDKPFKEMTLREYACIHLQVPDSGLEWLDNLISKN